MSHKCFRRWAVIAAVVAFGAFSVTSESNGKSIWKVQSIFSDRMPLIGPHVEDVANRISSETQIEIKLYQPGELVPPIQVLELVGNGKIDGGVAVPNLWLRKNEAFEAFTGSPSVRSGTEFYDWLRQGSGRSLYDKLYGQYGVKAIPCAIVGPKGMWSRQTIDSLKDLAGFKIRSSGVGAPKVMEKLGMKVVQLPGGEIYTAGERGIIDGTEYFTPYIDIESKFYQVWKYYYYPSFYSAFTITNFLFNLRQWNGLSASEQRTIERICHESVARSIAKDEKLATSALSDLKHKYGVKVREFTPEIWSAAEAAWQEVVTETSKRNSDFARNYEAYKEYRSLKETGIIIVKTNLKRADFKISGTKLFRGNGDYWMREGVPVGTYTISYEKVDGYETPPKAQKFIKGGAKVTFEGYYKQKAGSISISSNPSGAKIYLDGKYKSVTPDEIMDIPAGQYMVELRKSGYKNWKKSIEVKAGGEIPITARLESDDSTPPSIAIESPKVEDGKPIYVTDSSIFVEGIATDPSGIYEIIVNDTPASVSQGGRFTSKRIRLAFGENNISVEARDLKDNVKAMRIVVIRSPLQDKGEPLPKIVKRWFGKARSWAVVIGIDSYSKENGFEHLPYAVRDAKAVKQHLIENLGFAENRIKELYNKDATKKEILRILGDELPSEVTEEDRVLIFFSGHGMTREISKIKRGYLVPVDGNTESLHATCIPMTEINTLARQFPARQMLFIIDACYSGLAGIIKKSGKLTENTREQVEAFIKSGGRQILTAGTSEETAKMGEKWNQHSVFTYYLLRGLEGEADYNLDEVVTVFELHNFLAAKVPVEANQNPQLRYMVEGEGQFVFYREGELD